MKSIENQLHLKMRLYRFQLKKGIFIGEHTKFLEDLANVVEMIDDEDKTIILSSHLDEEYETFVLTLINVKQSLSYSDMSAAFVNHEVRRKNKESSSSSTSAEALIARDLVPIIGRVMEILESLKLVVVKS